MGPPPTSTSPAKSTWSPSVLKLAELLDAASTPSPAQTSSSPSWNVVQTPHRGDHSSARRILSDGADRAMVNTASSAAENVSEPTTETHHHEKAPDDEVDDDST